MVEKRPHEPVMLNEVLEGFSNVSISQFYEGTVGAGGHAQALLQAHPEIQLYMGCDRDPHALNIARAQLEPWKEKVKLIRGNFADLDQHLKENNIKQVDGFFLI